MYVQPFAGDPRRRNPETIHGSCVPKRRGSGHAVGNTRGAAGARSPLGWTCSIVEPKGPPCTWQDPRPGGDSAGLDENLLEADAELETSTGHPGDINPLYTDLLFKKSWSEP